MARVPSLHRRILLIRLLVAPTLLLAAVSATAADSRTRDLIALERAGTAAIESGRFGDALEAFSKATEVRPRDASLCFGAGVAAFMLAQDDVAQARFECALALNPDFLEAALWLADLHHRAGRLADAISIYEDIRERSAWTGTLQRKLDEWRKEQELQRRFREAHSKHFIASFERADDEPLARDVMARLEAAYQRIGQALGAYPSRPITVVLYTRDQFDEVTGLAAWSAAAYDGRIRLPIGGALEMPEERDRVLSHEFAHAMIAMVGGRTVPAWMSEGLATALEPAAIPDNDARVVAGRVPLGLSELERGFIRLSSSDAEAAYVSSARAVRVLIERRGLASLVALLHDLARGTPFARAFAQRLAMRYEDFAALIDTRQ